MRIDGIQLREGSTISNMTVANGLVFPDLPSLGEMFWLDTPGIDGLYLYNGAAWLLASQQPTSAIGTGLATSAGVLRVSSANASNIAVSSSGVDLAQVGTPGTFQLVTTDAYGRVTSGLNPTTLSGFGITDAVNISQLASTNSPNTAVLRGSTGNFAAGIITAALVGNASSATKLATARTINGVSFDGTSNVLFNTNSVSEGSTNLYFTAARASLAAPVQSVAGRAGAVVLTSSDVGLANVTNSLQIINAGGLPRASTNTLINRPAAGTSGAMFVATDTLALYYDNGKVWNLIHPIISGDLSTPLGSSVASLATVNSNIGTFNTLTVNGKGLVTAASNIAYLTANQIITASGDVTGSGSTALSLTLATVNPTPGVFGTATSVPVFTVNGKGLLTSSSSAAIAFPVTLVAGRTGSIILTTADVAESSNLYFTTARASSAAPVQSVFGRAGAVVLSSSDVTAALTFTPYSAANPAGYITSTGAPVQSVFGRGGAVVLTSADVTGALTFTPVNTAVLAQVNGVATLDAAGKLTSAQIPASLIGAVVYQGVWNAGTNTPALATGTGTKGQYYKVSVAGSTLIDGIASWNLNDVIIFDGDAWDKIDGITNEILSVAGRTGVVVLSTTDVSEASNLYYTQSRFDAAFAGKSTSTLAEGTNLYFTSARAGAASPVQSVAGRAGAVVLTSSDVSGVATAGTNSNITSLTGLTTPLSVLQGGSGVSTSTGSGSNVLSVSPALAGTPTAPTAASADSSTALATTAFVKAQGYITLAGAPVQSVFGRTGAVVLTSADVTGALTFTPYSAANPAGYITSTGAPVQSVAGRTGAVVLTTTDVTEGANLYFTLARAAAAAPVQSVAGRTGAVTLGKSDVGLGNVVNNLQIINAGFIPQISSNTLANRPTAGNTGAMFVSSNTLSWYRDNGTTWDLMSAALNGDATTAAGGSTITLATINSNVGTFNNVTVNAKGLVTGATNALYLTANQTITVTGDVTGSGTTAINLVLSNSGVTAGTYSLVVVDTKGRVTGGYLTTGSTASFYSGIFPQSSGTSTIAASNIAPVVTAGTQLFSKTLTPVSVNSDMLISFNALVDMSNSGATITIAIFRGNTFIGASISQSNKFGTNPTSLSIDVIDHPGVTTPVTYSARIGINTGTWYVGQTASANFGGVNNSVWNIREIL